MTFFHKTPPSILLVLLILGLGWQQAQSSTVQAASPLQLAITSFEPTQIAFGATGNLTVYGSFVEANHPVVKLSGWGALNTHFFNNTVITADLPNSLPSGTYSVSVLDDNGSALAPSQFTVLPPLPTPTLTNTAAPTATELSLPTATPVIPTETSTPSNTPPPTAFTRPQLVLQSSSNNRGLLTAGDTVEVQLTFANGGSSLATNVRITFTNGDLAPLTNGGIQILPNLNNGQSQKISQSFVVTNAVRDKSVAVLDIKAEYTTEGGQSYTDSFTLTLAVTPSTATPAPSQTASPSGTPLPTAFLRPLLVVESYGASAQRIVPGENLDFELTIQNLGQTSATTIQLTFSNGDFSPRATGGVRTVANLAPGQTARLFQPLIANNSLREKSIATLEVKVAYTNEQGTQYNDTFVLSFNVQPTPTARSGIGATATATSTSTPKPLVRPQLVINSYRTDVKQLQPGLEFVLEMDVHNVGNQDALRVNLIAGGGSTTSGSSSNGTPTTGGGSISGSGGDFSTFAPVGTSNVQFLDMVIQTGRIIAKQKLIVNANTKAGVYPFKVSLTYLDASGNSYSDDLVITLLVYNPPQVEISLMSEPYLEVGAPSILSFQVANLGRNPVTLGNLSVTAGDADLSNNLVLVGTLDVGSLGVFPLDVNVLPLQAGTLTIAAELNFTNDFGTLQKINQTFELQVQDAQPTPEIDPNTLPTPESESWWQRLLNFFGGLFGGGNNNSTAPQELQPNAPAAPVLR